MRGYKAPRKVEAIAMENWGYVVRTFAETDETLKHIIANGEWIPIIHKNSVFAMVDIVNARTLIFYKVRSNGNVVYRWQLYNERLTKYDIMNKIEKLRGYSKHDVLNGKINAKKFMKRKALAQHEERVREEDKIQELIEIFERYKNDYKQKLKELRGKRGKKYTEIRKKLREQIKTCEKHIERLKQQLEKFEEI